MDAKRYTLAEARATLPMIKQLMAQAQSARREILRLRPEAWPALSKAASNGGSREAGQLAQQFSRLESGVKGIMAYGVLIKDLDTGLVDFLGERDGHEILLCWRYGEEDILFWHDLQTGFAGRQPIDALVL
jgi:hypothetical protein